MDRRIKVSRALVLNHAGAPKEMEAFLKAPYAAGVSAAKNLRIGDVMWPASQYAASAGFPSTSVPGRTPAWVDHWSFVNGFIDTLGELALATDKEGRIVSHVVDRARVC